MMGKFEGLIIGALAFLVIGAFHPLVIKGEYYFSHRIWPAFLGAGIAFLVLSLLAKGTIAAALLGIIGFTCLWSIHELFAQKRRVERGWFPANPKRSASVPARLAGVGVPEAGAASASRRVEPARLAGAGVPTRRAMPARLANTGVGRRNEG
jgi:hypothetical protein